jgi:signal transduction histidine kinase
LFAALRWQLKHCSAGAALLTCEKFPATEPHLSPETAIALFRYVEEALHLIVRDKTATAINLEVTLENASLKILLRQDGAPFVESDDRDFPEFASLKHRIWRLHGTFEVLQSTGASALSAVVPV